MIIALGGIFATFDRHDLSVSLFSQFMLAVVTCHQHIEVTSKLLMLHTITFIVNSANAHTPFAHRYATCKMHILRVHFQLCYLF